MKILLLGEASNLHWTLAEGLRTLGHDVTVVSNGSGFMDNRRDIDLRRTDYGVAGTIRYLGNLLRLPPARIRCRATEQSHIPATETRKKPMGL